MKLKKYCKNNVQNLFKLKLIKNKIYSKNFISIKNSLKVIYSYVALNKKILFIGALNKVKFFNKILKNNINIAFIPQSLLKNGFFSNIYVLKNFYLNKKKDVLKLLFNFKTFSFDLIVLFDKNVNNEITKLNKVPTIFLFDLQKDNLLNYNLNLVQLIEKENDIFYFLIYQIFNKYKKK